MKICYVILEYILRLIASSWHLVLDKPLPASPCVIAFWHGQMLPIWKLFSNGVKLSSTAPSRGSCALVSLNKDGQILSHLLTKWKYKLIRGSSSRNGKEVISEMVNITDDFYFLITPDGPRGPSQQCKAGAFVIAMQKQIPLYFLVCDIFHYKSFGKSWDNFALPLPFSKINVHISDAIHIEPSSDKTTINALMDYCNANFKKHW